jgi:nucleoside-diphosphate-sugar epimerase
VRTTVRSPSNEQLVRAAVASAGASGGQLTCCAADLTNDEGWDAAVAGCDYVLHVASPLGSGDSRDANALVAPARDGTLRVLRAAINAGVKRVVMTSAAVAAGPQGTDRVSDETVWADPSDPQFDAYRRSKILAERAAWDFMAGHAGSTTFSTILPGAVFGPVLTKQNPGSVPVIQRLLEGRPPGVPRIGLYVVDVRDLADLHIRAMTFPEAAGQRFIAAGDFMWMMDIARTLRSKLGAQAGKVPTLGLPDFLVRFLALFIPQLRTLTPMLGLKLSLTSEKARRTLGFSPRPATTTIVDCARSLVTDEIARSEK